MSLCAGSQSLLLPLLTPTVHNPQTFVAVLGWIWPNPGDTVFPSGVFPVVWLQASISQRFHPPSASSGLCGATFCLVLWSNFPSENLPGANWSQHIKSFTFISLFGSAGRWMPDDSDRVQVCCDLLTQLSVLAQSVFQTSPVFMRILLSSVRSRSAATPE